MIVKLPFADETCAVDLRGLRVRNLTPSPPRGTKDVAALVRSAVDQPLDGQPLAERCRGRTSAVIVVPDSTRKVALPAVLPVLLDRLNRGGLSPAAISVLVACGTHPAVPEKEIQDLVGPLPATVRVIQHDSRQDNDLVAVGELALNRQLRVHRLVAESDFVLTVGAVRHHYFAGFGGGPKMIFPGVAGYDEIQANHALVLESGSETEPRLHPGCNPGQLRGNPVAEEIARAADLCPPDMAVCLVPGNGKRFAWCGAGSWQSAFAAATERVRGWYEVLDERFRLAVATAGGAPGDATLIQAHKGLDAACRFLEPGGELLLVAGISMGAGSSEMEPFLDDPRPEAILQRLAVRWVQYGHTTLRIVDKTARFRVHLHSQMDPDLAIRLGFVPTADPAAVIEAWRTKTSDETVAVFAGGAVYPRGRK